MAATYREVHDEDIVYYLRDMNQELVESWRDTFGDYPDNIKISHGDLFVDGPAVDAVVLPGNSFGFMNGKAESTYLGYFGTEIQARLQKMIRDNFDGELLVGQAAVLPAFEQGGRDREKDWSLYNAGEEIKYVISSPTMRVPVASAVTPNAYLAFRAVILAISKHNRMPEVAPIRSALVPGLGTAAGGMPAKRCAWQMLQAYESFVLGKNQSRLRPVFLDEVVADHVKMCQYKGE